ncbi:MAG: hypothetical protein ACXVZI_12040 [Terriglobales bacterium]
MRSCLVAILAVTAATLFAQAPARVTVNAGAPANLRVIWVLQPDGRLLMYDAEQFRSWQGMKLPADARKNPESISISRSRVVLFAYPPDGRTALRRYWSSNAYAPELVGGAWDQRPASGGGFSILEATPTLYFSSDGQSLFWFEHRQQSVVRGGADITRDARFLAWTTDLKGDNPRQVAQFTLPPCKCETGVCSESCPEADAWAPDSGVSDFFFVTRWAPGQIGSRYEETSLYQKSGDAWTPRRLPDPVERFLDAADHGNVYIEAVPDAGCCGWANESDDITYVVRGDKALVIFDERRRFNNNNYDVSFFTAAAAFSPGLDRVAYTIAGNLQPNEEIRLSDGGKPSPDELKAIKQAMTELPRTEAVALSAPEHPVISLPNTELIGWLDGQRLLVLKSGELQAVDAASGKITPTGIKADAPKYVFLR